jgi:hypothetical protein
LDGHIDNEVTDGRGRGRIEEGLALIARKILRDAVPLGCDVFGNEVPQVESCVRAGVDDNPHAAFTVGCETYCVTPVPTFLAEGVPCCDDAVERVGCGAPVDGGESNVSRVLGEYCGVDGSFHRT